MAMDHNAPPLRIDKSFVHVHANRLKLLQIALGTLTLLLTITCFPNEVFLFCTSRLHQFTQLFNAVCVNGFFLVLTSLLATAYLCSVPDAYYQYNFLLL
ncbi:Protein R07A4.2, partial [Aphelenchoides avenae]